MEQARKSLAGEVTHKVIDLAHGVVSLPGKVFEAYEDAQKAGVIQGPKNIVREQTSKIDLTNVDASKLPLWSTRPMSEILERARASK